jgi:hypothetical protein
MLEKALMLPRLRMGACCRFVHASASRNADINAPLRNWETVPLFKDEKTGRTYLIYNGKKYPYPYRGEYEEVYSEELIQKWIREGKWQSLNNRPTLFMKPSYEKTKIWQLYYWMQYRKGIPTWQWHPMDKWFNWLMFLGFLGSIAQVIRFLYLFVYLDKEARGTPDKGHAGGWLR